MSNEKENEMSVAAFISEKMGSMSESEFDAMIRAESARMREVGLANVGRVADGWCTCDGDPHESDSVSYYERENFRHGWFHDPAKGGCGGITQTG